MPVTRKLVAQDENEENQWLKVDHDTRFIVNDTNEWQFLFGPNSSPSTNTYELKVAVKFNENSLDTIQLVGYLYDLSNSAIGNAATCSFNIYQITTPDWTENLIATVSGSQLSNNYFYANPTTASLAPIDFFGGDSIMVECLVVRLGVTYRQRIYANHLGIFDNVIQLRDYVDFLDLTKKDE